MSTIWPPVGARGTVEVELGGRPSTPMAVPQSPSPGPWAYPNDASPLGSSTYYSIRFSPPELRDDLARLAAWRHQVRAILEEVRDPGVARLKLQWWRDEAHRLVDGVPSHPLNRALQPLVARSGLPIAPLLQLVNEIEGAILCRELADDRALEAVCDADLGGLFELLARVHGLQDPEDLVAARCLGTFCALVYRIRDSGWLARQGRAPIPLTRLRSLGLTPDRLRLAEHRARLPEWLPELAQQARALLARPHHFAGLPASLRLRARILASLLDELEALSFQVAELRLSLTPWRKLWLAWRESHGSASTGATRSLTWAKPGSS